MKLFFKFTGSAWPIFIMFIFLVVLLIFSIIETLLNYNETVSPMVCPQGMYATAITPTSITCVRVK